MYVFSHCLTRTLFEDTGGLGWGVDSGLEEFGAGIVGGRGVCNCGGSVSVL